MAEAESKDRCKSHSVARMRSDTATNELDADRGDPNPNEENTSSHGKRVMRRLK